MFFSWSITLPVRLRDILISLGGTDSMYVCTVCMYVSVHCYYVCTADSILCVYMYVKAVCMNLFMCVYM